MASAAICRGDPQLLRVVFRIKKTCYEPASEELRMVASPTRDIRDWELEDTVKTLYSGLNEFFVEVGAPRNETMWYKLFVLKVKGDRGHVVSEEDFERELRLGDKPVLVELLYNDPKALVTEIDRKPADISVRTPPISTYEPIRFSPDEPIQYITDEPQPAGWELGPDTLTLDEYHTAEYYAVGGEMQCRVRSPPKNKKPDFHPHDHEHGHAESTPEKKEDSAIAEMGDGNVDMNSEKVGATQEGRVKDKRKKKCSKKEKRCAMKSNAGAEAARQIVHVPANSDRVAPRKVPSKNEPVSKKGAKVNRVTEAQQVVNENIATVAQKKVAAALKKIQATKERVSHDDMIQIDNIRAQKNREANAIKDFFKDKRGAANTLDINAIDSGEGCMGLYQQTTPRKDVTPMMRAREVIGDSASNVHHVETKNRELHDDKPQEEPEFTVNKFKKQSCNINEEIESPLLPESAKDSGFLKCLRKSSTPITKTVRSAVDVAKSFNSKADGADLEDGQENKETAKKSVIPESGKYVLMGAVGGTIGAVAAYMWVTRK